MRISNKRILSFVLVLALCISLLSSLGFTASAATVSYVTGNPSSKYQNVIMNWGTRGTTATFLSPNAVSFYTDNNVTYDELAELSGSSSTSSVPSSALYKELRALVTNNQNKTTSYDDTRALFAYTDCQESGTGSNFKISSFYSGKLIGPSWDSGKTWNREHTWPNSKGDANGSGENDIMMLRPTATSENGSRGNKAYGESTGYYFPNTASNGAYDVRGDVARIMLYVYTRWGTANMWGSSGVIESKDILLKWMEEDPVDTWELGRNDSVESITGTRNVYVDYPELAFLLFNEEVPSMTTPSGEAEGSGTTIPTTPTTTDPTEPEVTGPAVVTNPVAGTAYKFGMIQESVSTTSVYYLKGGMAQTYYLATDTSIDAAIDFYLETTNGGYYLYTMSGSTKQYLNMVVNDTHVNGVYEDSASTVYTFDAATETIVATVNDTLYRFGTRSDKSYTTVGPVKVEMDNYYCKFYTTEGGDVPTTPTDPTDPTTPTDPEGTVVTIAEALAIGAEMEHNNYTTEKYFVTGTILQVYQTTYGNMYLTDGNGNNLTIYGTYSADGSVRYDALDVKPVEGDTVTIYGAIGQYSGTPQIKNGWIVDHVPGVPEETEPTEPAGEPDASISFADKANRTTFTTSQQVWKQNDITVTNDKASSTSNVADYADPARFYKSSKLTIAAEGMTKMVIHCNTLGYADALVASIPTTAGVTVTQDISDVTITFSSAVDSFVIETLSAQVRVNSIDIYLGDTESPAVPGDIDGDGEITNDDVVILLWHTLFPNDYPLDGQDYDYDNDGQISNEDVVHLLWHTLFPDNYPL